MQLHSGEGHTQLRYGPGPTTSGPFYAYEKEGEDLRRLAESESVRCGPAKDCIVSAKGTPRRVRLSAVIHPEGRQAYRGETLTTAKPLKLGVPAKARTAGLRALRSRNKVRTAVTVTVADGAGNERTLRRTLKFKR